MPGAGISGKSGDVKIGTTQIAEIKTWSFNPKSNNPKYSSNKTGGYKRTVAGIKEASGQMTGVFDPADQFITVIDVGTDVTLKLYLNATLFYSVPSVIDDYKINVDLDTGEYVSWEGTFSANGAWTNPVSSLMMPMTANAQSINPELVKQTAEKMAMNAVSPELAELIRSIVKDAVKETIALQGLAEDGMLGATEGKTAEDIAAAIVSDAVEAKANAGADAEPKRNIKTMTLQEATEARLQNGLDPTTVKPVPLKPDAAPGK